MGVGGGESGSLKTKPTPPPKKKNKNTQNQTKPQNHFLQISQPPPLPPPKNEICDEKRNIDIPEGDVILLRDIRWSDTRAMDIIYYIDWG